MQNIKKIACINDFSGFGRCSLSVALPILSVCGVQCCSLPTAVFSNHTGFESFFKLDLTDSFTEYTREWDKLGLHFDAIYSGYLGSKEQVTLVTDFIDRFKTSDTIIIVDPVMGDNGKLYKSFAKETADGLKTLVKKADIITPNLTEACFLADMPYVSSPSEKTLRELAKRIDPDSQKRTVITGIVSSDSVITNYISCENEFSVYESIADVPSRSGTGDVFASIIAAAAVNDIPFTDSVKIAADFVKQSAEYSHRMGIPDTDGAVFEPFLYKLGEIFA
ncbi:MAG: pyridoxamine kinase [Ruminococcus sp.]|nr:pyridoxamine kinase [Ruminococcus sp.]